MSFRNYIWRSWNLRIRVSWIIQHIFESAQGLRWKSFFLEVCLFWIHVRNAVETGNLGSCAWMASILCFQRPPVFSHMSTSLKHPVKHLVHKVVSAELTVFLIFLAQQKLIETMTFKKKKKEPCTSCDCSAIKVWATVVSTPTPGKCPCVTVRLFLSPSAAKWIW